MTPASVTVYAERCAASGTCQKIAPQVFSADANGWVVLLDANPAPEDLDAVLEAQDACPLSVIEVYDGNGEPLE